MVRRGDIATVTVGTIALVALAFAPLADLRVINSRHSLRLFDITLIGLVLPIVALAVGVFTVAQISQQRALPRAITIIYAGLSIVSLLGVGIFEAADTFIPRRWLPSTVRRFTISSGSQWAGWVAAALLAAMSLAASGNLFRLLQRAGGRLPHETAAPYLTRVASLAFGIGGAVLIGIGRQTDWLTVHTPTQDVHVSTWAIPFFGPVTLVILLLLAVFLAMTACRVWTLGSAVFGAGLSWLLATVCGLALAASGLFTRRWAFHSLLKRLGIDTGGNFDVVRGSGPTYGLLGAMLLGLALSTYVATLGEAQ